MRTRAVALAGGVAVVGMACVIPQATAAPRTTVPVLAYRADVVLTDSTVQIMGHTRVTWARGAVIQFLVKNTGTRPYTAEVKLISEHHFTQWERKITTLHTRLIPPEETGKVRVYFYYRGTFALQALNNKQPHGQPATITII